MKKIFLLASVLVLSSIAHAGTFLKPMGMYRSYKSTDNPTVSTTLIEIGTGYITDKGWLFGAIYVSDGSNVDSGSTFYGPSLGWTTMREVGPYIVGHYFVPKTANTSTFTDSTKSSGYKIDLGFKLALRRMALALEMSYRTYMSKSDSYSFSTTYIGPAAGFLITF